MARAHRQLAPAKLRLVQVARSRLGLADDDYRSLLARAAGVSSSRDLTENGFHQVMEIFGMLGFQSDSNKRNLGRRPGFATAGQVAAIRRLWLEYTNGEGTEMQLNHWLERTWGVSALRFLTAENGPKAILALRAMCRRRSTLPARSEEKQA